MELRQFDIPAWIKISFLVVLVAFSGAVASGSFFGNDPILIVAASVDLLFTAPIVYWLSIRGTAIPKITVVPVFLASCLVASFLLPANDRWLLSAVITYAVPAVEVVALSYIVLRIVAISREYRAYNGADNDLIERLRHAFVKTIRPAQVARAAAFEFGLFGFLLFRWRKTNFPMAFSSHRTNGAVAVLCLLLFLLVAETFVVHIVISLWSTTVAWITTALSIYLLLQITAHLKAVFLRPIVVGDEALHLRSGILADARIPYENVHSIHKVDISETIDGFTVTPLARMTSPNIRLVAKTDQTVYGCYGMEHSTRELLFFVDDSDRFVTEVKRRSSTL